LSAAGALLAAGGFSAFPRTDPEPFEFLVIGDSLVWGQGLKEEQKFYYLTKQWLQNGVFNGNGRVNLKVKAHSGSTIKLDPTELAALESAGRNAFEELHPEVNVSFPTIEKQVRSAVEEYADPGTVDLIMVSAGIPDVGVAKIINPFESDQKLRERIDLYCREHLAEVLGDAARSFPNSLIAVIGYYPIITRHSPMKRIVNDIMELYRVPRWAKPPLNNPVTRNIWRLWRGKMIKRSRIWHEYSNAAFQDVVAGITRASERQRAVFVPSPIDEKTAFGTRNSLLFTVARKGRPADPKGEVRLEECGPALSELRRETRLRYRTRFCELASVGHPNVEGAAAIADAIRDTLRPLMAAKVSNP
jgi:lysophospholipase L1-like esterase